MAPEPPAPIDHRLLDQLAMIPPLKAIGNKTGAQLLAPQALPLLGALILATHLSSLRQFYLGFWIFFALSLLLTASLLILSRSIGAVCIVPVLSGLIRYGPHHQVTWDVVSFEAPNYIDWLLHAKGPYWTYSLFPGSYLVPSTASETLTRLVFFFSLLLFSLSIAYITRLLTGLQRATYCAIAAFLLYNLFYTLFHLGKGDLFAASFLNLAFASFMTLAFSCKNSDATDGETATASAFIFGSLAVAAKSGLLAITAILLGMCIYKCYQLGMKPRLTSMSVAALGISTLAISPYLAKLLWFGPLGPQDYAIARSGSSYSIFATRREFYEAFLALKPIPLIIVATVSLSLLGVLINKRSRLFKADIVFMFAASLASMTFMPFVVVHGYTSFESMRLIAQPLMLIVLLPFL